MNHKVISRFRDLQTGHIYNVGDSFPHDGSEVKKSRLKELASDKNKLKKVLIIEVDDSIKTETDKTVANSDPNLLDENQTSNESSLEENKGE